MKSKNTKLAASLGAALAAAMMLTVAPIQAQTTTFDVSPTVLLEQVYASVEAGDVQAALALLARLQQMGVTNIVVGGNAINVAQLQQLVASGSPQAVQVLAAYVAQAQNVTATFNYNVTTVAAAQTPRDTFPTSSAG